MTGPIPDSVLEAMRTRYQEVPGLRQIAAEFGYARTTIRRAFLGKGWTLRPSAGPLPGPVQQDGYWLIALAGEMAAGRLAMVDDADYAVVAGHRWSVWERQRPDGGVNGPYARTSTKMPDGRVTSTFMHKLLTGYERTDHRNGDGLDNRRANLRPATTAQNNHNQRPRRGASSRFKGVTWLADSHKWQAMIKIDGKGRYLGVFAAEEDAAHAYDVAAQAAYGAYAYLNFGWPA